MHLTCVKPGKIAFFNRMLYTTIYESVYPRVPFYGA